MAALHWTPATEAELADTAYTSKDFPEPHVEVWLEHWEALLLYRRFSTQWRVGFAGPFALDYNVFHHYLDRKGVQDKEFDKIMDCISIIEMAAVMQRATPA